MIYRPRAYSLISLVRNGPAAILAFAIKAGLAGFGLEASTEDLPTVSSVLPAPGIVNELRSVTVNFNKPVQDVLAEYLFINNRPAATVVGTGVSYTFSFDQPAFGMVDIT